MRFRTFMESKSAKAIIAEIAKDLAKKYLDDNYNPTEGGCGDYAVELHDILKKKNINTEIWGIVQWLGKNFPKVDRLNAIPDSITEYDIIHNYLLTDYGPLDAKGFRSELDMLKEQSWPKALGNGISYVKGV